MIINTLKISDDISEFITTQQRDYHDGLIDRARMAFNITNILYDEFNEFSVPVQIAIFKDEGGV